MGRSAGNGLGAPTRPSRACTTPRPRPTPLRRPCGLLSAHTPLAGEVQPSQATWLRAMNNQTPQQKWHFRGDGAVVGQVRSTARDGSLFLDTCN